MKIILIVYLGLNLLSSIKSHYKLSRKGLRLYLKDADNKLSETKSSLDSLEKYFGIGFINGLINIGYLINTLIILIGLYYLTKVIS